MSRIEKRLWVISVSLFTLALIASASFSLSIGGALTDFPYTQLANLRRALRPNREGQKIERVSSVVGITDLRIQTTSTNIRISRNEDLRDLSVKLEGHFLKTEMSPLGFDKTSSSISLRVDDGLSHMSWVGAFDDENRQSELSIVLPRQYSGNVDIETVSGETRLSGLSLSELNWRSISGTLENRGGEIHIARLKSVSGDLDFAGECLEFDANVTSANAHVILHGLEHLTNPKIDMQSVSGKMDLAISQHASVRISLSSFTGQTSSTVDLKKSMHSAGALEGQLGAGAGELRLRSVSGSARLSTF